MKLAEAYSILELPSTATPEEAKTKFKKLAKKYHPDINKDPDAETKFKKFSEANDVIQAGEKEQPVMDWGQAQHPFNVVFNKRQHFSTTIELHTSLSFKESVEGCKKDIKYNRQIKCVYCHGNGNKPTNNGCTRCGGRGQIAANMNGSIFIQSCPNCQGKSHNVPCTNCNASGIVSTEASIQVSVPPAVIEGNTLRLPNMGNFAGTFMGMQDQYTDLFLHLHVNLEPGLRLEDKDVVSEVSISLLDALRGCNLEVNSIDGNKNITINSGIKNKEEVILSVGEHNIKHRVIVNVSYPADLKKIINLLTEEGKIK